MRLQWTEEELEFLAKFGHSARVVDVYEAFVNEFGDERSYHSVQKKLKKVWESLGDLQNDDDPDDDLEEDYDTWEDHDQEELRVKKYTYDKETDEYLIPTRKGILHVSGSRIRQLLTEYSNYGAKKTVNMVAREFGWARHAVIEILRRLGKTHDSAPFTDEQIVEEPVEDLVSDAVRKKEHRVLAKAHQRNLKEIEKAADKWNDVQRSIEEVFEAKDYTLPPVLKQISLKKPKQQFDVVLHHTDAHVGKLGEGWSFDQCRDIILQSAERALAHATAYGKPTRIITGIGGDWSNIDTPGHTTTRGTPQRSFADWQEIMHQANKIQLELLLLMGQVAPTEAYTTPGNHDRSWSVMAGSWLHFMFKDNPHINVHLAKHRHYIKSGSNMIMLTHGDGAKPREYPSIMASEASQIWGQTQHRYAYHGHLHHEVQKEFRGAMVTQMPSVSPEDEWHKQEGWIGTKRALAAYVHDYKAGRVAQFNVHITEDGTVLG